MLIIKNSSWTIADIYWKYIEKYTIIGEGKLMKLMNENWEYSHRSIVGIKN